MIDKIIFFLNFKDKLFGKQPKYLLINFEVVYETFVMKKLFQAKINY